MIQSVIHAMQLLELFSEEKPEMSLAELAERAQLKKSTLHHTLAALQAEGIIDRTPDRKYRLGVKLLVLGTRVLNRLEVGREAEPHLHDLQNRLQETVHLAVCEGMEAVYIRKLESARSIRVGTQMGQRVPLHCSGVGKVLLAFNPHLVEPVLSRPLVRRTNHTITDPAVLLQELELIQARRYALDEGEFEEGLMCIAAPIFDHRARVIASLSISGPIARIKTLPTARLAASVQSTATAISQEMGFPWCKLS
ncbi:MAG: IclR family transcriptional regulator [Ktedonobacteraceae bacterium]|nr:IclR family transcriptional regulator [Ktedonobacteraceae bacterium]